MNEFHSTILSQYNLKIFKRRIFIREKKNEKNKEVNLRLFFQLQNEGKRKKKIQIEIFCLHHRKSVCLHINGACEQQVFFCFRVLRRRRRQQSSKL